MTVKTSLIINILIHPEMSSRNSLLYNTKRDRISSISNRDRDLFCQRRRAKMEHNSNADTCKKVEFPQILYGWTAKTANSAATLRKFTNLQSYPCSVFSIGSKFYGSNACLLTQGNSSEFQESFLEIIFSTLDSHRDHPQRIHFRAPQRERESVLETAVSETLFEKDDTK